MKKLFILILLCILIFAFYLFYLEESNDVEIKSNSRLELIVKTRSSLNYLIFFSKPLHSIDSEYSLSIIKGAIDNTKSVIKICKLDEGRKKANYIECEDLNSDISKLQHSIKSL
jgi:hypothetical protein